MNINKLLKEKYKIYHQISETILVKNKKKYIITIYSKSIILLRAEYYFLGSYSKNNNIWIWADQSLLLSKLMTNNIHKIRKNILNDNISTNMRNFIKNNYMIIPTMELEKNIEYLETLLNKNIIFVNNKENIDIIILNKIIFNNL